MSDADSENVSTDRTFDSLSVAATHAIPKRPTHSIKIHEEDYPSQQPTKSPPKSSRSGSQDHNEHAFVFSTGHQPYSTTPADITLPQQAERFSNEVRRSTAAALIAGDDVVTVGIEPMARMQPTTSRTAPAAFKGLEAVGGRPTLDYTYVMVSINEELSFFVVGRVFSTILWKNQQTLKHVSLVSAKEQAYGKIYRFVVIKPKINQHYSKCIRISTYGGQGASKKGINQKGTR
ncbi:hypothetical protein MMC13_007865 [Lambiella insularis]|nr:hypothetical protein [Lambiella insularis]